MHNNEPLNETQKRILVFSLLIIILLAALYFLFFGDIPPIQPRPTATPVATFATVNEAIENLPPPTSAPTPDPTAPSTATPEPSPTPIPQPNEIVSLKKGSKGVDVVNLQARLIELGYLPAGSNDGSYGTGTESAVKDFQRVNKLKADGIAGKETQTRLYSQDALKKP